MPKLIKDRALIEDDWNFIADSDDVQQADGRHILPLAAFTEAWQQNTVDFENTAVSLIGSDDVQVLAPCLDRLQLIALNFESFMDGRSFSQARILRDELEFAGEIRAVGNYLQDQMFYLSRCGVNGFALKDDADVASALLRLDDFSESYQAAADEPQPLFRRRV